MRWFRTRPDDINWGKLYKYDLTAAHRWVLPGIKCPRCGAWATFGAQYPSVDLSGLPNLHLYESSGPLEPELFDEVRAPLIPLMPDRSLPGPGTMFGPMSGRAKGS